MPKKEIAADRFIESHPEFDGRGAVIAIFDSGVDPAASGLQVTSDGKPKILDVIDCTGSGDVDTSKVVKADENGCIRGASGTSLVVNSSSKNPSGEWHVGYKLVYELFTDTLTSRLKKERKKKWDEKNQEEIAVAVKHLDGFNQKYSTPDDANLKKVREDLQNRVDILRKQADSYDDKGPIIDAVVWHDGELWRAALDTQSLDDDPDCGKLANFVPLTNYRTERKFGVFSKLDACSCVLNVYDEGNVLSIVTDSSPHGTHVAGIATAFHSKEPLLNGVAPGAQLISCKIGDSRLGSMETGTGLTRALIAAVEHKCDLINMSYGEPSLLADYGRFVDLVNEVVNKHRLIFVSSAGNSGPALSTFGAPGGTSSSIIGVGAYVSPAMAAGAHAVVEPPAEGLEYTWSSRGPTADGDLGVSISAPGGAVAPFPTWTLQKRMLMNGTSMASPSACGGIALLVSAMKAEGIPVSPYIVRKALENTCVPVGESLADKLSTGHGLMQVDKAHEYIQKSKNIPSVWYEIKVNRSGKSSPTTRGIYLRESSACQQPTEWTVQVEPKFHEGASKMEDLVPFEECIELHSTEKAVVMAPEYLLLTHNGRSFNIVVDPTMLSDGLHYYEVYGVDCKAPWRGPIFRIPITITKPMAIKNRPPLVSFTRMSFQPGHIERRFIEVPNGANWVEATMRTSGFDTSRRFFVDTVQICPLQRPIKWESVVSFSSPTTKSFTFPVVGGQTMELVIAQFWSSGIGSHESALVDFEIRVPYRPIDAKLTTLTADRDKLPSGKQTLALTLTYKFKLEDAAEVKPQVPLLNNRIYDTKFESQFYMISDANKRVYAMGDVYPTSSKLPKGEYSLRLFLRHDHVQYLEKLKQLVLFLDRNLDDKDVIRLNFFTEPDGPVMGNGAFNSSILVPGKREAIYLGPPVREKFPKSAAQGSVLLGAISYGKLSSGSQGGKNPEKNPVSYRVSYVVPPNKLRRANSAGNMSRAIPILLFLLNFGLRFIFCSADRLMVRMTLVPNATALGALCLDGSSPGYHFDRGFGAGSRNWILQFEGGGWCNDLKSCLERANSRHGSTRYMNKMASFSGILSNDPNFNPDFYNWNRVKLRYCDGASFAGDATFDNGTTLLHFKGQKIWDSIIQDLLPQGLGQARKALLSGCSAGGLSAFLHCDNFASKLPKNASVKCLSDAGFFMDEKDISLNRTQRSFFESLVTLQGVEKNLNSKCRRFFSDPKLCIFPQYLLRFIQTPFFILNTAYDVYQLNHILVPPSADLRGHWRRCKLDPANCNETQIDIVQGFRRDMLVALRHFFKRARHGGMYINSCFAHCQSESQDTWFAPDSPRIHNKTIATAVGDWYFSRRISKQIDCPYPCDKTCHNLIPTASVL